MNNEEEADRVTNDNERTFLSLLCLVSAVSEFLSFSPLNQTKPETVVLLFMSIVVRAGAE